MDFKLLRLHTYLCRFEKKSARDKKQGHTCNQRPSRYINHYE